MSFTMPSGPDALEKAKKAASKKKCHSLAVEPSINPVPSKSTAPSKAIDGGGSSKKPRVDFDEEEENISVIIPKNTCVYSNPLSIEGYVEALLCPRDETHLKEMGSIESSNDLVSGAYRMLSNVIDIRRDHQRLARENRDLRKSNTKLRSGLTKVDERLKASKELNEDLKRQLKDKESELVKEKKNSNDLCAQLEDIAVKPMWKARKELLTEFKEGKSKDWKVDEELELYVGMFEDEAGLVDGGSIGPRFCMGFPQDEDGGN
ncbi:uncharacterized protein LOC133780447 [Humulus lupulus]|uniref:uncharacterized protein LOC133780447 n=1 Tax=Humulus lupulus TaxID=3486 RepID=UPI002B40B9B9|nr:uncharacterized protein LOC133780447 [Humulus lupulus]XP_062076172.1 uncharacterized protein LOC133780447 [Humulus lupulus]